jgi:hypothetical protein
MPIRSEALFSYGTLQLEPVQRATFGRKLEGTADTLPGFEQALLEIADPTVIATSGKTHHPIVRFTGREADLVRGAVFQITEDELKNADRYEVAAYKRIAVTLGSGTRAWVYIDVQHAPPGS